MSKYEVAEKKEQSQLLNIIDYDLQNESKILKELIENVISSNQKIKKIYSEELEKNDQELKKLSEDSQKIQNKMLDTENIKKKQLLDTFIKSQSQIYKLNEDIRFNLFNVDYQENILNDFYESVKNTNTNIKDSLDNITNEFKDKIISYQNYKDLSFNSVIKLTSQSIDLINKFYSTKTDDFDSIYKLEMFLDKYVEEFRMHQSLIDMNDNFNNLKETMSLLLNDYNIESNNYKQFIKDYLDSIHELKNDLELKIEEKTKIYKESLDSKFESIYAKEFVELVELENQVNQLKLEIEFKKKNNESFYDLGLKLEQLNKRLNKKTKIKNLKKVGKFESSLRKKLEKTNFKKIKSNFVKVQKNSTELLNRFENLEINHVKKLVNFYSKSLNLYQNLNKFTKDKFFELTDIFEDFKKEITIKINHNLKEQEEISLTNYMFIEKSNAFIDIYNEKRNSLKNESNKIDELFKLNLAKQQLHIDYHTNKLKINLESLLNNRFVESFDQKNNLTITVDKLRLKEKFQSAIIDNEILIDNAKKEYEIEIDKIKHIEKHEKSLNFVQEERTNSSLDVTVSMLKAMIQRQVNFAEQQIRFAEEEYLERLKHIDTLNDQEIIYIKQRISDIKDKFLNQIKVVEDDFSQRKDTLEKRKVFFTSTKEIQKIDDEIKQEKEKSLKNIKKIEKELIENDLYTKYENQLKLINEQVLKSKTEALEIKDNSIKLFNQLKDESYHKLESFNETINMPKLLPNYSLDIKNISNKSTLQIAINQAEKILLAKLEKPEKELQILKNQI
jgi:hypothetical protein